MHSKRCLQNSKMGTAVLVKVSIRRVGGGLGLSCGGKNFCERADFEEFLAIWRKNNGKVLISEFFLPF